MLFVILYCIRINKASNFKPHQKKLTFKARNEDPEVLAGCPAHIAFYAPGISNVIKAQATEPATKSTFKRPQQKMR